MTNRKYLFDLPYSIPAAYIIGGFNQLQSTGILNKLPEKLQQKLLKSKETWLSARVTERDLNSIDDETWTQIASLLGLKWEKIESEGIPYDPEGSVRTRKTE